MRQHGMGRLTARRGMRAMSLGLVSSVADRHRRSHTVNGFILGMKRNNREEESWKLHQILTRFFMSSTLAIQNGSPAMAGAAPCMGPRQVGWSKKEQRDSYFVLLGLGIKEVH